MRELAPEKVPASCEECRPVELLPACRLAVELVERFPGLVRAGLAGPEIDYPSAIRIAGRTGIDWLFFIEALEALAGAARSAHESGPD